MLCFVFFLAISFVFYDTLSFLTKKCSTSMFAYAQTQPQQQLQCPDPNNPDSWDRLAVPPGCPTTKDYHDQLDGGYKFPGYTFKNYAEKIISTGSGIIFSLAVLKLIYAGMLYSTAAGDSTKIESAKGHITSTLLGIALLVAMNVLLLLIGVDTY